VIALVIVDVPVDPNVARILNLNCFPAELAAIAAIVMLLAELSEQDVTVVPVETSRSIIQHFIDAPEPDAGKVWKVSFKVMIAVEALYTGFPVVMLTSMNASEAFTSLVDA
jgi:hypothetical protein